MTLIEEAERIAKEEHDGHLTVLRFTTGWKAVFGTPDLLERDRERIFALPTAETIDDALLDLLARES